MATWTETPRLRLRRFTPADAGVLADLHGDPGVMRFVDDGSPVSREVVEGMTLPGFLAEYRDLPAGLGCFAAVNSETDQFAGWFSVRPATSRGLGGGGIEVGYRLLPAVWGRGFATEGLQAVLRKAFAELGVERVVATTMTVNTRSRRVLEKAGLKLVRTFFLEWPEYLEGAEHGDVEYALSREEWVSSTARH
ncbi:GNAT family N-acetyltransferase [Amycolatopsis sp. NPDC051373]|uniref:GNAT family N-acetyltransferase n=1 Tax=Amycolatopsis sp. NPDC051373 TaxID=3155801 RepID=UPI00344ECD8E